MKKGFFFFLIVFVIIATVSLAEVSLQKGVSYATLQQGSKGEDVLHLKQAMYWLGYFQTLEILSNEYTDATKERVMQLQEKNGLTPDGIASPELQALVFSGSCIPSGTQPNPSPTPSPQPTLAAPKATPSLPPLTDKGFLSTESNQTEYVYEDAADGLWRYISGGLSIEIRRYQDIQQRLVWFETEIYASPEEPLTSYMTTTGKYVGSDRTTPVKFAKERRIVLALSDDYYGVRIGTKNRPGVIIRGGVLLHDTTLPAGYHAMPNLDTLAVFADGSMKAYPNAAMTGDEYLALGATDVFAFGPVLVSEGKRGETVDFSAYYHYREPRCAIGMIAPYHYLIVTVVGRTDDAKGVYFDWLADKMLEKGVTEALNLDGGATTALVFMGKPINSSGTNPRGVGSMIGFGTSPFIN